MSDAYKENIPRKVVGNEGLIWWIAEIAGSRANVRKARKDFQRAVDPTARAQLCGVWRTLRLSYKK